MTRYYTSTLSLRVPVIRSPPGSQLERNRANWRIILASFMPDSDAQHRRNRRPTLGLSDSIGVCDAIPGLRSPHVVPAPPPSQAVALTPTPALSISTETETGCYRWVFFGPSFLERVMTANEARHRHSATDYVQLLGTRLQFGRGFVPHPRSPIRRESGVIPIPGSNRGFRTLPL